MKKITKSISLWITAAVLIILGILCIVADNASGETKIDAFKNISLVLGIAFIVIASLAILANILLTKKATNSQTISAGGVLAAGIYFVCQREVAATLLICLFDYVPYLLIVCGSLVVLDGIITLVLSIKNKEVIRLAVVACIIFAIIGGLAILFGVLALPQVDVISAKFTIFGIILLIYGLLLVLEGVFTFIGYAAFNKLKKDIDSNTIDAEVIEINNESNNN